MSIEQLKCPIYFYTACFQRKKKRPRKDYCWSNIIDSRNCREENYLTEGTVGLISSYPPPHPLKRKEEHTRFTTVPLK